MPGVAFVDSDDVMGRALFDMNEEVTRVENERNEWRAKAQVFEGLLKNEYEASLRWVLGFYVATALVIGETVGILWLLSR